jgi:hypothetical protein
MTKQINATSFDATKTGTNALGENPSIGWLTWWTIEEKDWQADALKAAGSAVGLPTWMIDRIKGRNPMSAWKTATQLSARGKPSRFIADYDPKGSISRYLVRDLGEGARALVREVNNGQEERVSSDTVAQIYFVQKTGALAYNVTTKANDHPALLEEVKAILAGMASDMKRKSGTVDDGRVRALVQSWLEQQFRVCVRGTGGVYLVPMPKAKAMTGRKGWIARETGCNLSPKFGSILE